MGKVGKPFDARLTMDEKGACGYRVRREKGAQGMRVSLAVLPWWASGPHYECRGDWLTSCIQIDGGSVAQVVPGPHVEGGRTAARASI